MIVLLSTSQHSSITITVVMETESAVYFSDASHIFLTLCSYIIYFPCWAMDDLPFPFHFLFYHHYNGSKLLQLHPVNDIVILWRMWNIFESFESRAVPSVQILSNVQVKNEVQMSSCMLMGLIMAFSLCPYLRNTGRNEPWWRGCTVPVGLLSVRDGRGNDDEKWVRPGVNHWVDEVGLCSGSQNKSVWTKQDSKLCIERRRQQTCWPFTLCHTTSQSFRRTPPRR